LSRPVIERVGSWVLGKPQPLKGGEVLGEVRDPATREKEGREGEREGGGRRIIGDRKTKS
jgi:hypothetical protein